MAILRSCRAARRTNARLLALEQIAPDPAALGRDEQFDLAAKDLNMLVRVGGNGQTLTEYTELLAAAALKLEAVHRGAA